MHMVQVVVRAVLVEEIRILQNLFEFYAYDFSVYLDFEINEQGLFDSLSAEDYLADKSFEPLFIELSGKIVGFAIVKKLENQQSFEMEQFFVMKRFSGQGVGSQAARAIFDSYRGKWTVTQVERNYPAQAFWRKVIKQYTNNEYGESYDGKRRSLQQFHN